MEDSYHTRKHHRLKNFDYSSPYAYYVTICTSERQKILSTIGVQNNDLTDLYDNESDKLRYEIVRKHTPQLTELGKLVDKAINNIPSIYDNVSIGPYIIMPDHVHMIFRIRRPESNHEKAVSVGRIIKGIKQYVSAKANREIWQKSYYDHVIRNDRDYEEIAKYINNNGMHWYHEMLKSRSLD